MNRSAADVIHHLQARIARLEDRTRNIRTASFDEEAFMFFGSLSRRSIAPTVKAALNKLDPVLHFSQKVDTRIGMAIMHEFIAQNPGVEFDENSKFEIISIRNSKWNTLSGEGFIGKAHLNTGTVCDIDIDCVITPSDGVPIDFSTTLAINIMCGVNVRR